MLNRDDIVDDHLDEQLIIDELLRMLREPTEVPLGANTLMAPDDPKLVHFVQKVVRPAFEEIGAYEIIEAPLNQFVVRIGEGTSDKALLIMAYTPTQHANLMDNPFNARIAMGTQHGYDEPCAFGQGATQNKSHIAAMLGVINLLLDAGVELPGTLYFGINNEGRSSHDCSDAIIRALPTKPTLCVVLQRTGWRLQLGNRGRVDVKVTVKGEASHSSRPDLGHNAIMGANKAIDRIANMTFEKVHPLLGGIHAEPYQVIYSPLAPHTLPDTALITVDRRLLPGDDINAAVDEVRRAIGDLSPFEVTVERGVHMLPALVEANDPGVRAVVGAHKTIHGTEPEPYYHLGAYDAGGPLSHGIPTVQYGLAGATSLLGEDFVPISGVLDEARVLATLIMDYLG